MELTHVKMWKNGKGFIPVTLEEAIREYPHRVSGASGIFHCGVCLEPITLAIGPQRQFFRHTDEEKEKSCPERTHGPDYNTYKSTSLHTTRILSLYLNLISSSPAEVEFHIGFSPLPGQLMQQQPSAGVTVSSVGEDGEIREDFRWDISNDWFSSDSFTYLSVGTIPMHEYRFQFTGQEDAIRQLRTNWGISVSGISGQDSMVFDENTGRKIQKGTDVEVGHRYLLLQRRQGFARTFGIDIQQIKIKNPDWFLYRVRAIELSKSAAVFFLRYGMNLVGHQANVEPVWPAFLKYKDILLYEGREVVLLQHGEGVSRAFPQQDITDWEAKRIDTSKPDCFVSFRSKEIQQLLCFGRHDRIFNAIYLRQVDPAQITNMQTWLPDINLIDEDGVELKAVDHVFHVLPKGRHIYISKPSYDGHADILKDDCLCQRLLMKSQERMEVQDISFGTEIRVYQGLDLVSTFRFEKEVRTSKNSTQDSCYSNLLESLQGTNTVIPQAWAHLKTILKDYPRTLYWFRRAIRRGYAPTRAVTLFKNIISEVEKN